MIDMFYLSPRITAPTVALKYSDRKRKECML